VLDYFFFTGGGGAGLDDVVGVFSVPAVVLEVLPLIMPLI
jgi:hypothetical protein